MPSQLPTTINAAEAPLFQACVGVTGPANDQYEWFGRSEGRVHMGPGAAVVRLFGPGNTVFGITSFVTSSHKLYGLAALAVIDHLYREEIVTFDDSDADKRAFQLVIYCKAKGTDAYARKFIARWKKAGGLKSDKRKPRDWEVWDRLNTFCSLGYVRFEVDAWEPWRGVAATRVEPLYEFASELKQAAQHLRTKASKLAFEKVQRLNRRELMGWWPTFNPDKAAPTKRQRARVRKTGKLLVF